jgi:hypothetical protein
MMPSGFICLAIMDDRKKGDKEEVLNLAEFHRAGVSRGTLDQLPDCAILIRSLMHQLKCSDDK